MTINSQPAVNGEKSDNSVYGWGGANGRVYQKAYVEFFTSPDNFGIMRELIDKSYPNLRYYVINSEGKTNYPPNDSKGVTALTWGVFPDREILQPTIFDPDTFTVWSEEAFQLWTSAWASLYDDETESSALLYEMHDTFFLVAIVDNDYIEPTLFNFFKDIIRLNNCKGENI
jgi:methylenetetrahydrofolate reductase (NADPH)